MSNAFLKSTKKREGCVFVVVDVFLVEGVEGVDVVSGSVMWREFDLTLVQDIMLTEEGLQTIFHHFEKPILPCLVC